MSAEHETSIEINEALKEPPMYNVIYMNDDTTSMEFVITSLIEHFSYSASTAEKIAVIVHEEGKANVATLPFEIAEQKGTEVTYEARRLGFPLAIQLKKDIA